jgi:hypothetical protein
MGDEWRADQLSCQRSICDSCSVDLRVTEMWQPWGMLWEQWRVEMENGRQLGSYPIYFDQQDNFKRPWKEMHFAPKQLHDRE